MASGGRGEWSKPPIIIAILSLLSGTGWAAYGISAKASQDIESRLRTLEISVSAIAARQTALIEAWRRP